MDHEVTETVNIDRAGSNPQATRVVRSRTLSVVGAGRAGSALAAAAAAHGWEVVAVASRSRRTREALAQAVGARPAATPGAAARLAAVTLLTVPDHQVTSVAAAIGCGGLALRGRVIAHCAASLGVEALAAVRQTGAACGVIHPLQALAGAESASLLEQSHFHVTGDAAAADALRGLVGDLGASVLDLPADGRALYHAAAVLAGNAPLALLERATRLLVAAGVDAAVAHNALAALLEGAARNARRQGAAGALTGPVARNDATTVSAHLDALAVDPAVRDLYLRLAQETLALAGRQGRTETAAVLDSAEALTRAAEATQVA